MSVDVDVRAREAVPWWLAYGSPVFTVLAALAVGGVALLALGVSPLAAYEHMFVNTATTEFGVVQTLVRAVPLVLAGLAVYIPLRAGLWNIGAQGQLYLGAVAGTWIGVNVELPLTLRLPLLLVGAGLLGAIWGGIPGYLRARYGVNEIIVTLMLSFVGVQLTSYLVRGPMRGGAGNFPVSALLPPEATIPRLFGSLHAGIIVAGLAAVGVYLLFERFRLGYEITYVGANPDAARQAGMDTFAVYVLVLALGGALAGLAGAIEIAGVQGRLRPEFSPGYGFTAIPIALLGRNGVPQVVAAGVFFALLEVGGSSMEIAFSVPAALTDVIQALIILFLITAAFVKRYRVSVEIHRRGARDVAASGEEGA